MFAVAIASLFIRLHASPNQGWQKLTVTPGFNIELPPGLTELKFDAGDSAKNQGIVTKAFSDGVCSYTVTSISPTSKADSDMAPDKALSDYVAGVSHSLEPAQNKHQRDILFNGWPGLECVVQSQGGVAIYTRSYVIQGVIFSLGVGYPAVAGRPAPSERFLGSLTVSPGVPGPQKTPGPEFKLFQPEGGGFSIDMPSKPTGDKVDAPTGQTHRFVATYGNRRYVVVYTSTPTELFTATTAEKRRALGILLANAVKGFEAKAVSAPKTVKRQGREFQTVECSSSSGLWGRIEATIAGGTVYSILMSYPKGHAGSPDIDAYFNSFKSPPSASK